MPLHPVVVWIIFNRTKHKLCKSYPADKLAWIAARSMRPWPSGRRTADGVRWAAWPRTGGFPTATDSAKPIRRSTPSGRSGTSARATPRSSSAAAARAAAPVPLVRRDCARGVHSRCALAVSEFPRRYEHPAQIKKPVACYHAAGYEFSLAVLLNGWTTV